MSPPNVALGGAAKLTQASVNRQRQALGTLGISTQALFGGISGGAQQAYLNMSNFGLNAANATTATFGVLRGGLQEGFFNFLTGNFDNISASFENLGLKMVNIWSDVVAQMVTSWVASGLAGLFGTQVGIPNLAGGGGRPTFLSDRLEPQVFEDAFGVFRSRGFDDATARLLAGRVRNAVGNVGDGVFPGSKNNQADLQRAFTQSVNETLLAQKGPSVGLFTPTGRTLFAAMGFDGIINRPTTLQVADRGPERVMVEPLGRSGHREPGIVREGDTHIHIHLEKSVIASEREMDRFARKIEARIKKTQRRQFRRPTPLL